MVYDKAPSIEDLKRVGTCMLFKSSMLLLFKSSTANYAFFNKQEGALALSNI